MDWNELNVGDLSGRQGTKVRVRMTMRKKRGQWFAADHPESSSNASVSADATIWWAETVEAIISS